MEKVDYSPYKIGDKVLLKEDAMTCSHATGLPYTAHPLAGKVAILFKDTTYPYSILCTAQDEEKAAVHSGWYTLPSAIAGFADKIPEQREEVVVDGYSSLKW